MLCWAPVSINAGIICGACAGIGGGGPGAIAGAGCPDSCAKIAGSKPISTAIVGPTCTSASAGLGIPWTPKNPTSTIGTLNQPADTLLRLASSAEALQLDGSDMGPFQI